MSIDGKPRQKRIFSIKDVARRHGWLLASIILIVGVPILAYNAAVEKSDCSGPARSCVTVLPVKKSFPAIVQRPVQKSASQQATPRASPVEQTADPAPKRHHARVAVTGLARPPLASSTASCVVSPEDHFVWRHFGGAPYAATREEAMASRDSALRCLGFPSEVIALFDEAMATPGKKIALKNGDILLAMLSRTPDGTVVVHKDTSVQFDEPTKGMGYVAYAEVWSVVWQGETFTVALPEVCENWSRLSEAPPEKSAFLNCVELGFNVEPGDVVTWEVASADGKLPPSECYAQREDNGPWVAWFGRCGGCEIAASYFEAILGRPIEILQRFIYPTTGTHQTLRFSDAIMTKVVYVCIERPDGTQVRAFFMRPEDWKGQRHHEVADHLVD